MTPDEQRKSRGDQIIKTFLLTQVRFFMSYTLNFNKVHVVVFNSLIKCMIIAFYNVDAAFALTFCCTLRSNVCFSLV